MGNDSALASGRATGLAGQEDERDRQRQGDGVPVLFAGAATARQFQVQAIVEQFGQRPRFRQRCRRALLYGDACDLALAPDQGNQSAGGVRGEP